MAEILGYSMAVPGHLYPMVDTLLALKSRGHSVQLLMVGPGAESVPEWAGIPARRVSVHFDVKAANEGRRDAAAEQFARLGEPMATPLERAVGDSSPDLLVVDAAMWGALIAAESSGLPWVSIAHSPTLIRGLGVDPRGPGFAPPAGVLGRVSHWILERVLCRARSDHLSIINAARVARKLPVLSDTWDLFFGSPLTLAFTAEPFEYPRSDWPASLRFVGPTLWNPPAPVPTWLDDLDHRPLILSTVSSLPHDELEARGTERLVSAVLEGFAGSEYQVVLTIPSGRLPSTVPSNIRVHRFVPHGHLLPRAACVVCHGGAGITQRALAAGVPVVAVPWGLDRFEIARRIEVAGAGVRLPMEQLTPARLRTAVCEALGCRAGAARVADGFRRAGGVSAAVESIEALLRLN